MSDGSTTLAIIDHGRVKAWGYNGNGRLGTGDRWDRSVPHRVGHLVGVEEVAFGDEPALALTRRGRIWAWGENMCGALGTGDFRDRLRPARIPGLRHITRIFTSGYNTSFALQRNGTLWAWGYGYDGDRGDGSKKACSPRPHRVRHKMFTPRRVRGLPAIEKVWPGQGATYVRDRTGRIWAWGAGPLGDGHRRGSARPVRIPAVDGATKLVLNAGYEARFALVPDGRILGWGKNWYNSVGTGSLDPVLRPTALPGLVGSRDVGVRLDSGYAWGTDFLKAWGTSYDAYARPQYIPWGPRTAEGLTGIRWAAPWSVDSHHSSMDYTLLLADGTVQRLNVPFQQPVG